MIPPSFDYHAPRTLPDAVGLLGRLGDEAKVLSGGQSLLPLLKLRFAQPAHVVDIGRIPGLDYIKEEGGFLKIGALVRESALEASPLVRSRYPILADTAAVIADPLVRNMATVGGNLAHADPANDHPATMLAYGAEAVATGAGGTRVMPVADFFQGTFQTALGPGEILTEIRIPASKPRSGGAYFKVERKVGDFATAAVAAQVTLDKSGNCESVGIGLTNVGWTPIKAVQAEGALKGTAPDDAAIREAARLAAESAQPAGDQRGSEEYKRSLVKTLTVRALRTAVARAQGGQK